MSIQNADRSRRFADRLIRYRHVTLALAVAITGFAFVPASRLAFDQSIESLYAPSDPYLKDYQESKTLFGGDEFAVVAYAETGLLTESSRVSSDSRERMKRLKDALNRVPGVVASDTQTLVDAMNPKEMNLATRMLLRKRRDELLDLFTGLLIGTDRQTTAIVLRLMSENRSPVPRAKTIAGIRQIAAANDRPTYVVGEPVQIHDMFRYVEEDGRKLFHISLLVLAATIFILFRSIRWVILPLLVVVAAITWTEALLVISRLQLSMVSSMLNSLMTIIGIATVTHVTVHYRELRRRNERLDSLRQTWLDLAPAVFWTCMTTAVGFAALFSSEITPVRSFALMMALGTMMVLLASAAILPGGILLGRINRDPQDAPAEGWLDRTLNHTTVWSERHPKLVAFTAVVVVLFVAFGFTRLTVETEFSKNFRASSPIRRALVFVETRLGGAGTWEVNFSADASDMDKVAELSQTLRDTATTRHWPLTKVLSLSDGVDLIPGSVVSKTPVSDKLKKLASLQPTFEPNLFNSQQGRMRIVLRAQEQQQSDSKRGLIDEVQEIARTEFPDAKATGLFVLLTQLIESLLRDQLVSFALAAVGICLMMTLAFRSLRMGLVSLIPNLFPIVLVVGTMGWIGLPINIATAMIASVSMGLTVDSTIHYASAFHRERRSGLSFEDALRATHSRVGRALVFANLALILGFSVLTLSHFIPLIYFGILVSVAMLGGLTGNLILLPLLLRLIEKDDPETTPIESEQTQAAELQSPA